jgi:2-keto-4-pentenoate hydratase/2-oxohepta-3-ene-1,7-dioic acid hydratase in catechol pathway
MAFNDVSARDLQMRTGQWLSGKTLDTFAPCGPSLVVNEISDPQNLNIATRINGQTLQQSNTRNMIFSVAETIAYISQLMTLEPGDIIATGTPEGVGFKRNPPIFLHNGDIVEVEIEGIGTLRNPVVRNA